MMRESKKLILTSLWEKDGVITSTTCHRKIFECLIPRERESDRKRMCETGRL